MTEKKSSAPPSPSPPPKARALWGGHFESDQAEIMTKINASIDFDKRLYAQDIEGSLAHADMLVAQGVLTVDEGIAITAGLTEILGEIEGGGFPFDTALEDIHMNIEARLVARIGDAGKKLHTGRSRNDQVATDLKLWVRAALDRLDTEMQALQATLIARAEEHAASVMPGFTHLQPAQPVTLGHHLLAYVEMFGRDRGRATDARARLNESPLGAAALAGTSFPLDRGMTARTLGFDRPTANSMDSVSDRDFALEAMAMAAIAAVHLSRLAEELVIWSSDAFGFVRLSEAYTTGSSIMPQKRNPDAAELVRGKAGRVIGDLVSLLVTMKGLPLAYSKDMQEDKEPVFDAMETISLCLRAMTGMVEDMTFDTERLRAMAGARFTTATDLADWLVRELALPFREAHHVTGRIVKLAEQRGCALEEMPMDVLKSVDDRITEDVRDVLGVDRSVASRTSAGGTAPDNVRAAAAAARERFL